VLQPDINWGFHKLPLPAGEGWVTPSRKGRGDFHSLSARGRDFGHLLPLPLREGVGGWGLVKIAIYFCPAYIWTLDKIDVGQGATNGSSLTTPGLVYLG
jgi:hypothetical protein